MTIWVPSHRLVAVLVSLAGIAVSIYLTVVHYAGFVPACPASGAINCEAVLSSPYSVLGGTSIPTSVAGIVWFAVSAVLWARPRRSLLLAWSLLGLLTVISLLFIEIVLVGAICLWCTAAHVFVVVLVLLSLSPSGRGLGRGA